MWKYVDDGSNQGTTWVGRAFNDSQWMAGPAKLGYGGDGELTTVSYGTNAINKFLTTYFRKSFVVANPAAFSGLLLRLIRDDGVVVYLNGAEVYRNNIQAGPVSWNSLATAAVDGVAETTPLDVMLGTGGLLTGTNVLAVEVHQVSANNSDLGFDLALLGLNSTNTTEGVYLTAPAQGTHFNAPANVALSAYVVAPAPVTLVEYFDGAVKVAQATVNPYNATWVSAPIGVHTLTARVTYDAGLQMTSGPVTISAGNPPPPIFPVFATLIAPSSGWKYWDSASAVSNGWQSAALDDNAWPSANARFGWGLDGELTPLTEGRVTHYFRRWLTLANGGQLSDLLFELVRDDGAVVYLNGTEVYRSNMPAGPIAASTLALGAVNTPEETTWFETMLATAGSGLLSGSNLLAVELHQSSATSSDASFDFALYAQGTTEQRVYLSTPANGAQFVSSTPIPLEALAWAGTGRSVAKVEFFSDGMKVGESTSGPYRTTLLGADFGTHVLTARLTDNNGGTLDSVPVSVSVTRELVTTTLIPSNSVWRFLDNGSNQGTNWAQLAYNETGWGTGPARLGFGGDGEVTPLRGQPVVTYYFRKTFVVPFGVIYTNLLFNLVRDDGAVVWLNGREAYRSNMGAGTISFNTFAAATVNSPDEQVFFPTIITVTNLPAGTNLVAVEVHQVNGTSSDIGFNLELVGSGYLEDTTPPLLAVELADGVVELSWPSVTAGWRVYGAATVDAPANAWSPVAGTPVVVNGRNVLTVTPSAAQQFFRLGRP
jgi:hypothetical protein